MHFYQLLPIFAAAALTSAIPTSSPSDLSARAPSSYNCLLTFDYSCYGTCCTISSGTWAYAVLNPDVVDTFADKTIYSTPACTANNGAAVNNPLVIQDAKIAPGTLQISKNGANLQFNYVSGVQGTVGELFMSTNTDHCTITASGTHFVCGVSCPKH